jgi:hypothetical protein
MNTSFTSKQREVLARKLGYEGPMQGFDQYLQSSPALMMRYNAVTDKYAKRMAKGGVVGYADGGLVRNADGTYTDQATGQKYAANSIYFTNPSPEDPNPPQALLKPGAQAIVTSPAPSPAPEPAPTPSATQTPGPIDGVGPLPNPNPTPTFTTLRPPPDPSAPSPAPAPEPSAPSPAPAPEPSAPAPSPVDPTKGAVTGGGNVTFEEEQGRAGTPKPGEAAGITPATTPVTEEQQISTEPRLGEAKTTPAEKMAEAGQAAAPPAVGTSTYEASTAAEDVKTAVEGTKPLSIEEWGKDKAFPTVMEDLPDGRSVSARRAAYEEYVRNFKPEGGVQAVKGTVSEQAQVDAQTQDPTTSVVGDIEAARLDTAQKVAEVPARTVQEGEIITGSAVDQQKMEELVQKTKDSAAQGEVTEEMTVSGQLAKLTANYDMKNPPPWAAASLRAATAVMAARGLGASSMAGQALLQAAIESALPVATANAETYRSMAEKNLSNKQAAAMLAAEQRAAFLNQEFDQEFQTRVQNAAKIADIANANFTAQQQVALENARLAQSVDLANLSNEQATVMAKAAAMSALETQNLSNQQQAAVANAQAFLQMDMSNADREQRAALFKTEQITQALLADVSAENAAKQFNANSKNQTEQFMASLTSTVNQFNVAQKNAVEQFNVDQANSIAKFNTEQKNMRDQFNANQRLVIDQSNAQWRREISTADTAATNTANYLNSQNLQQMTLAEYNNEVQLFRDQVEMMWKSFESEAERINALARSQIEAKANLDAVQQKGLFDTLDSIGELVGKLNPFKW